MPCFLALLLLLFGACDRHGRRTSEAAPRSDEVEYRGMCDASGAVALGAGQFAVADDEDNVLRVYDAAHGGAPRAAVDVSAALGLLGKKRVREADIEAATRFGPYALWLTSHGRNSRGKRQHERFKFFATTAPEHGSLLEPVGTPYEALLDDLLSDPKLASLDLPAAAQRAPKAEGGLNIEGLSATLDGTAVLIGFRNPVPGGRAIVVPFENPSAVLRGEHARFGAPALLDLDGLGVRSIGVWHGSYVISAGAAQDEDDRAARLFLWDGTTTPRPLDVDLPDFTPEALVSFAGRAELLMLSDDGARRSGGGRCKDEIDPSQKHFRGRWVKLPAP
jgi:hypothetical protein